MYRYFALVWDSVDEQAASASREISQQLRRISPGWVRLFEAPGVLAFHADVEHGASGSVVLARGTGVILGRIFKRDLDDAAARVAFGEAESLQLLKGGAAWLLERYWGRYVALLHDPGTRESQVLRDPSGALPCLFVSCRGVSLIFSDLEDCVSLQMPGFSVCWSYIRALVAHSALQLRQTALKEVSEIQPGELVRWAAAGVRRSFAWSPFDIALMHPIEDGQRAVTELRRTTRACVHVWAACYPRIIHNLSGGLDSSIVLSCLMDAPSRPQVTCLHYFGTGPDEDERSYARVMSARAQVDLIEHRLDVHELRLEGVRALRRTPRPWPYLYELEHGRFEGDLAAARGALGLFSGGGGDGVFYQARADLAVADYLFAHGMGRDWLRTAVDAAYVSGQSVWRLLMKAARARLWPYRPDALSWEANAVRTLVNEEVLQAANRETARRCEWFTAQVTRDIPPGVLWHVLSIATPPAYYSSFCDGAYPERTMPLISQPLVELCLRIPTYVLIRGGQDRAIARRAFASDLPAQINTRRHKGRIDRHLRNIMDANLPLVREMLLDGYLVREGLLNRRMLERYLTRETSPADHQYLEILQQHLCTEAWLASWLDGRSV